MSVASFELLYIAIRHGRDRSQSNQQHTAWGWISRAQRKKATDCSSEKGTSRWLSTQARGGELPRGYLSQQARRLNVHRSTIQRVFTDIKNQMAMGNVINVRSKKLGKTGPKPKEYTDKFLQSAPLYKRATERSYGAALKISSTAIHKLKKQGRLRTHTSTNHPALTSNHKIARMKWVLNHILPATQNRDPKFMDMQQVVHVDEKWFYLNLENRRFYLLPNEPNPYRAQQSKRFKIKGIMAAIGKPVFSLMEKYFMMENMEYGHLSKWPSHLPKDIFIQWDNARPHQIPMDEEFESACQSEGFNIQFIYQPA
ncbi:uncharacterized protein LOC110719217 [Chenopodium quinoa]|uniref:uncharacterized protein LOC110719217 n=1 Tax=Chenopodium quinoa TaxID=63459 RepID=UPI000B78B2BE|nr:uncharacterized protein LOC110719217 [Chenopodium quinoa]